MPKPMDDARSALPERSGAQRRSTNSTNTQETYGITIKPLYGRHNNYKDVSEEVERIKRLLKADYGTFFYELDKKQVWHAHGSFVQRKNYLRSKLFKQGWRIFIEPLRDVKLWNHYIRKQQPEPKDPLEQELNEYAFVDEEVVASNSTTQAKPS